MLKRGVAERRALVLTFDDGPGKRLTPAILKILAENNARATFFLLGRNIPGREDIVSAIAEQGHEICSHGYDHLHHWKVSPILAIRDIKKCWRAIDSALGRKQGSYRFRPPFGKLNLVTFLFLLWNRIPIVYWTFDIGDTWDHDRPDTVSITQRLKKSAGAVVLAHDFEREDRPDIDEFVLDCLRSILSVARERGMRFITVSELAFESASIKVS